MNIIKASLERPIAIVSVIIMTIILGIVALDRIPIQIAPDVNKPLISVLLIGLVHLHMKWREK